MVPAVIIVRVLEAVGATEYLAIVFTPLMEVMGLPGWTSIVWTTAILSNLYAALAVLAGSEGFTSLSTAQMSVLATTMLLAHSLPVEARITQALGVKFVHMVVIRLIAAMVLGIVLNLLYSSMGLLQEPLTLSWKLPSSQVGQTGSFFAILLAEVISLSSLSLIVFVLVVLMEVLKEIRVVYYCEVLLYPLLRFIGLSPGLSHILAVSALLGLTYSSGLLIAESKQKDFAKKDLAVAFVFISLCHALPEDSIIMILSGAHISAVLFARLFFCILLATILMRWRHSDLLKFYHQ